MQTELISFNHSSDLDGNDVSATAPFLVGLESHATAPLARCELNDALSENCRRPACSKSVGHSNLGAEHWSSRWSNSPTDQTAFALKGNARYLR